MNRSTVDYECLAFSSYFLFSQAFGNCLVDSFSSPSLSSPSCCFLLYLYRNPFSNGNFFLFRISLNSLSLDSFFSSHISFSFDYFSLWMKALYHMEEILSSVNPFMISFYTRISLIFLSSFPEPFTAGQ